MKLFRNKRFTWWQWILLGIGALTTLSILMNLFFITTPARPDEIKVSGPISIADDSLINTLSVLVDSPIISGGEVKILNNGDEFFPALYNDIENAQSSIHLSTYIWKEGVVSNEFLALLTKKAQQGVKVRIILDGFGAKTITDKELGALKDAGGEVSWFHPARFGTLTKYHKRNHARAIVIDEKVAYTGGMAVADYWTGNAQSPEHWRDMMFRLTGAQVAQSQKTFNALWEITSGTVITSTPIATDSSPLRSLGITNLTPDEDIEQLSVFLITSITAAKESILITTPYMILDERMEHALLAAKERGVDVKILLPGEVIDSKLVQSASQSYYKTLLKNGVEIYEYTPTMLHSKTIVIDGTWSMIGSANIDTRSTFFNVENLIAIQDVSLGKKLQETFFKDLEVSKQITLADWKDRSIVRKIMEPLCSIIDKQL